MEPYSKTVVLRGTERYHMEAYLIKRGYHPLGPDHFVASDVEAVFEPQRKVPLGSIQITEVSVSFKGKAEAVDEEAVRLRLQFMTAGG